jgi:Xaa-Pro dipeptidase
MQEKKLKNLLVTDPDDIFYYTGQRVSMASLLIAEEPRLFVFPVDNEAEKAKIDVVFLDKPMNFFKYLRTKTLGYDEYHMDVKFFLKLKKKVRLKPSGKVIKQPRLVKDSWELQQIKKSVSVAKKVFSSIDFLGKTESGLSGEIHLKILKLGARPCFDAIVAAGSNGYFVHHVPSKKSIQKKDLVIVDLGAKHRDYCSDITRTFCLSPGRKEKKLLEDVKDIQSQIIDKIQPEIKMKDLQKTYETLMKKKHYKVLHGIGHSLGLRVHEPIEILKENSVITIEPGVYIKKFGGCRIEDMVLVKKKKVEVLTKSI